MADSDDSFGRDSDEDLFEELSDPGVKNEDLPSESDGKKKSGKKVPPKVKKFEEDILDDEDWMLTHGETLKE
jgi:hypothetical protein